MASQPKILTTPPPVTLHSKALFPISFLCAMINVGSVPNGSPGIWRSSPGIPSLPCHLSPPPPSCTTLFPRDKGLSSLLEKEFGIRFSSLLTRISPLHIPFAALKPLVHNRDPTKLSCLGSEIDASARSTSIFLLSFCN